MEVTTEPVATPTPAWADVGELKSLLKNQKRELDMSLEEKGLIEKESDIMKEQVMHCVCCVICCVSVCCSVRYKI